MKSAEPRKTTGQLQKTEVILPMFVIANQQRPARAQPTQDAFHYPPPRLVALLRLARSLLLADAAKAIVERLLKFDKGDLPRELACYVLTLGFGEEDPSRMKELAEKNQVGVLSIQEQEELRNYVKAGHFLARLHSKARKSLKR